MPFCRRETYAVVIAALARTGVYLDDKSILNVRQDFNSLPGYRLACVTRTDEFLEPSHILLSVYDNHDNTITVQFYLETRGYYHDYQGMIEDPNFIPGLIDTFERFLDTIESFYKLVVIKYNG